MLFGLWGFKKKIDLNWLSWLFLIAKIQVFLGEGGLNLFFPFKICQMFLYIRRQLFRSGSLVSFSNFIYSYFPGILTTSAGQGIFSWLNTQQAAVKDLKRKNKKQNESPVMKIRNIPCSRLAAYNKSICHIYCSHSAAWLCTITMYNSVSVFAGIVSVTGVLLSSGHA